MWGSLRLAPIIIIIIIIIYRLRTFNSSMWGSLRLAPIIILLYISRVYNKEGRRVSYSIIAPCTAVVRRLMIFTMCGVIYGVIVGNLIV